MKMRTTREKIYIAIGNNEQYIGDKDELADIFCVTPTQIIRTCSRNTSIKLEGKNFWIDVLYGPENISKYYKPPVEKDWV